MVKRFLALHKNLFPIKALRDIDQHRVRLGAGRHSSDSSTGHEIND